MREYLKQLFSFDDGRPLLFTQLDFWVFFLLVYAIYTIIVSVGKGRGRNKARRLWRNGYLFAISLFFYYKTSGGFVLLLVFSTILGYTLGVWMDRLAEEGKSRTTGAKAVWRKVMMIAGVAANLAMLAYFKYAYFFTDMVNTIAGSHYSIANAILLPVGISFFTFQNISYIVDVYEGKVRHVGNMLDFGFYTSFFPQLVAGPIIRADQFVPQLYKPYFLSRRQFGIALFWILNGLVKKIVLSDYLAVNFVDRVFDNPTLYTAFENLSALFIYSLQVYADFSGYTDIAIGVAMLMGFYLPVNFRSPYKATNAAGFWKRWHISLSGWLKDYLYIPLGGNRNATAGTYTILAVMLAVVVLMAKQTWVTVVAAVIAAVLILYYVALPTRRKELNTNINNFDTMLLGGLWHGASFNFITWGALNGIGILVYKWWKRCGHENRIAYAILIAMGALSALCIVPCALTRLLAVGCCLSAVVIIVLEVGLLRRMKKGLPDGQSRLYVVWNTLLTFVFISFTRLFFRSGSNLDPADANETAWRTATQMVEQIGGHWNLAQIPHIVTHYGCVFLLFIIGMVIHWLPDNFKRRYRLTFAHLPLWAMGLIVVAAVVLVYQFISSDMQPFIYFQF